MMSQQHYMLSQQPAIKPHKFNHVKIAYNIQKKRQVEIENQQQQQQLSANANNLNQNNIVSLQQMTGDQNPTIIQLVGSVNDEAQALAYQQAMDAQMRSQLMMQQQQQPGANETLDQQALLVAHAQ